MTDVIIAGGGIGGLTLALMLHRAGIACRVYEAAPEIREVGVGVNILPHATRELAELGLMEALAKVAVTTRDACFYNRFGQLIYREPLGKHAGYEWPQFSIHRGDLQAVLLEACKQRIGPDRILTGWRCTRADQDGSGATARFNEAGTARELPPQRGSAVIGCDGINSAIRRQLYPGEGPPVYSGVNMWRGVTRWRPILSGASFVRAGWHATGKAVIYPIRNDIDADGRQLVNWLAEVETPKHQLRDWNRPGDIKDFIARYEDWHFDWLDVPALLEAADMILEYPMVDQDPLERWTFGRLTLLGDAAHPMYPRGANGAAQSILDCRTLADCLKNERDPQVALGQYESARLPATAKVVLTNRQNPPDAILREVFLRTGDRPFRSIGDVISREELAGMSESYHRISGSDRASVAR